MKIASILGIAAVIGAVVYFGNLGIAANTIQVVLQDVVINSITNFTIKLTIQNVSNATLNINSMSGVVTLNGTQIGNVSSFTGQVQVLPNSEKTIAVTLNPSLLSLPGVIMDILSNRSGSSNLNFAVTGTINLNSIDIPFNVSDVITV